MSNKLLSDASALEPMPKISKKQIMQIARDQEHTQHKEAEVTHSEHQKQQLAPHPHHSSHHQVTAPKKEA